MREAGAPPGTYDRCEVTWSGWSIIACGGTSKWQALPASAMERVLSVGDMTWTFDVSVARNDMEVRLRTHPPPHPRPRAAPAARSRSRGRAWRRLS